MATAAPPVLGTSTDWPAWTDEGFWTASLDVLRGRIDQYAALAAEI